MNVIIRLRGENSASNWRDEPWVYAKAVKWYEDEDEALAEAERLNQLDDDPMYVYFVSHPKPGSLI